MCATTQPSSPSNFNSPIGITVDARQTSRKPSSSSSHGPITRGALRPGHEPPFPLGEGIPARGNRFASPLGGTGRKYEGASTSRRERYLPSLQSRGDQGLLPSTYLDIPRGMLEIHGFNELEARQGEEIKALSEQLFAAGEHVDA
ncbi:unnamed protein product [Cyclocybe aegerita]|uniref:Uncharacterized protein n=1 Tax=Cyclocybe aegerita TaxID=1973307 RepID=A0A8S0WC24_CYCAE|nr:unnamed protein product [Cyclocybe aegerita]